MNKNNSVEIAYQNAKDLIDKKDYITASEPVSYTHLTLPTKA